jgi:hypothetical protein
MALLLKKQSNAFTRPELAGSAQDTRKADLGQLLNSERSGERRTLLKVWIRKFEGCCSF